MAGQPPSGTVTFLLTDLEGSTRLWEQDFEAMKAAMVRHDELLDEIIARNDGYVFSRMGDGMAAAFPTAKDAMTAAEAIRRALAAEPWATTTPLRARIGLHTDEAIVVNENYANQPINRCSRLMTAAHGGQVVISGATEALVRDELADGIGLIDLGEHRLRDLGRPMRVFQLTRDGDREEFPPLRSLDAFPGNLPAQVSSFIGRQADVSRVTAALENSRVVTITGVGGVGKTRLAIQVTADLLPRYRDGAWLVELAPVRDPAGVVEAVTSMFQLAVRSGTSLEDCLVEMLAQKRLLLLLDNCEHLLGSVAELVTRIERACPDVAVLATSREGMAIDGERLIALPPLNAGKPGEDIEQLAQTDAVCLFVERARHVKDDFALTATNVGAVVEICQRLDGVPLAIELAAARVIALSPPELLRRLDRRFQVLAGGRRGAITRHATLRAAIDWSFDLLSVAEQRLLARMAVFSGGCTLEAVEEVCTGETVDRDAALDLLASLVGRSLVIAEDRGIGMRYRLLETIRQYAEERLVEWDETEAQAIRHGRFYAALLARAAERSYGPEQLVWARQLNLERDNIRAALDNAIDASDTALAVKLVVDYPHRHNQGTTPMGDALLVPAGRVVGLVDASNEPGYAMAITVAAYEAFAGGDYDIAEDLCRRALEAQDGHPRIEIDVNALRAQIRIAYGAFADGASAFTRAAELAHAEGFLGLAGIYLAYSVSAALLGNVDIEAASTRAERAVALARESGMPGAIVVSLNALALTLIDHQPELAREFLQESIERSSTPDGEISQSFITACLAAARLGDWTLTLALLARQMHLWRWNMVETLQAGPSLALSARALADQRPEVAGLLQGAAYAVFRRGARRPQNPRRPDSDASFFVVLLRETDEIVSAAFGEDGRRELLAAGAAMSMDEAVSYALANVEPKWKTSESMATHGR